MEHFSFGLPFHIRISFQVSMKSFYLLKITTHAMQVCIFCPGYTQQRANLGKSEVGNWIISLVQKAVPSELRQTRLHTQLDQEVLQDHQLGMSHSKDRKGHVCLNEDFSGFRVIKPCSRKPMHCLILNVSDFTGVLSRVVLWYIKKKKSSSWAKLSSSTQACPSTSSSEGMDPVSTYCLTCSISHFTNRSGSYCILSSARG